MKTVSGRSVGPAPYRVVCTRRSAGAIMINAESDSGRRDRLSGRFVSPPLLREGRSESSKVVGFPFRPCRPPLSLIGQATPIKAKFKEARAKWICLVIYLLSFLCQDEPIFGEATQAGRKGGQRRLFVYIFLEAAASASHGVSSTLLRRPRRVNWTWLNGPHKTLLYIVKIGIYMCACARVCLRVSPLC